MSTTHYEFPTINGTDAIDGVDAINGLANAVDTALYAVDSTVGGQATDIQTALDNAASASAAATAASTNAAAAQATASAAVNTATAANTTAGNTASALNTFMQKFNLVPQTITSGLAVNGWTYSLTLAQNDDGSIFKFYGNLESAANASKSMTRVAIPGGSGTFAYGVATGLVLNTHPDNAYFVTPAAVYGSSDGSWLKTFGRMGFAVGTDGQIYINCGSSTSSTFTTAWQYSYFFMPCLYFNASFGDVNQD